VALAGVTVAVNITDAPKFEVAGLAESVVVEAALFTVAEKAPDVLAALLASPL
jgi:hypothetical protein